MLKGIISAVFLAVACTFLYGQQPSITTFLKEGAPVEVIPVCLLLIEVINIYIGKSRIH